MKHARNRWLSVALAASLVISSGAFAEVQFVEPAGTMSSYLGAEGHFYSDYGTLDEALEAGNRLHLQMVEDGQVLLKNENGALPLASDERDVTFLGLGTIDYVRGGGGSGQSNSTSYALDWVQAFEQKGFHVNSKTIDLYENLFAAQGGQHDNAASGGLLEADMSYYSKSVTSTFNAFGDVAFVAISRFGRENMDTPTNNVDGHSNPDDHYLQLDDNEHALIKMAKENFGKVVVLLNSSMIMEIPELVAPVDTEYGVDAILWVGGIGDQGTLAAAEIITGEVNPSGRTVDIWYSDFKADPTWTNAGDMSQNFDENGERMNAWLTYEDGTTSLFSDVEFREGIYYGYRFYETKADDMNAAEEGSGDAWYKEAVLYPFGYGLSYTDFEWELIPSEDEMVITAPNQVLTMKVKVTNVGSVPGKDVVELYATTPYYEGGIEKASAVLMAFDKTKLLAPGESQELTLSFNAQDMASYDWEDINENDFYGYELEAGDYVLSARRNSHEKVLEETYTIGEGILCETDLVTGEEIHNVFEDDFITVRDDLLDNMISRADGLEQPAAQTAEERVLEDWEASILDAENTYYPYNDEEGQPWYVSEVPAGWTQGAPTDVQPAMLAGKVYTEPTVEDGVATAADDEASQLWDSYMNSLSWEDLTALVLGGESGVDGPVQFGGTCWQSTPMAAATWNKELVAKQGVMYGNQALLVGYVAWRGPGTNIHRTPFNGRVFEYYSEDPMLTATMAALIVDGCQSKGVNCYAKHMFANVQEFNRADYGGVCTFATEQVFREIYLRSFEWMVKYGHSAGMMTSFNRVGYVVNSNNWAVHEDLLRGEWNFGGSTITDAWAKDFVSQDLMVRAGDDTVLGDDPSFKNTLTRGEWDASLRDGMGDVLVPNEDGDGTMESTTHYFNVRKSAQRLLQSKVNSIDFKNFASDYELTATLTYGLSNATEIHCDETSDFSVELIEGQELPEGISVNGFVVDYAQPILGQYQPGDPEYQEGWIADNNIYGDFAPQGTYKVLVNMACDGYISVENVTLTIDVVSPFQVNGENVSGIDGANPVINLKAGEETELAIDSQALAYQAFLTSGGFMPWQVTNWYVKQGGRYLRNEEKTHADGVTIDISEAEEFHEVAYTVEGEIPGMEVSYPEGTAYGLRTNKPITVKTGAVLAGAPEAGTYTITVSANIPYAPALAGIWLMPAMGGELTFSQSFDVVVE